MMLVAVETKDSTRYHKVFRSYVGFREKWFIIKCSTCTFCTKDQSLFECDVNDSQWQKGAQTESRNRGAIISWLSNQYGGNKVIYKVTETQEMGC